MNKEFFLYDKCKLLANRYDELNNKLTYELNLPQNEQKVLKKEFSNLEDNIDLLKQYCFLVEQYQSCEKIIQSKDEEKEMIEMAREELIELDKQIEGLENDVKKALLPKDDDDSCNVILEVRAGTGGDEASIFAYELFKMYMRFCEKQRWKFEIMGASENGAGGYKEASMAINGKNVFGILKFEAGTHRVQRVPTTEANGRIHTSAVTVAVLPEHDDIDIKIEEKDLRIDIYRASGNGGQCVNTTDSAVRLTHLPTGLIVIQQDEKSQHKNRAKAMRVLKARLYELEKEKRDAIISSDRKSQIGSGDRSEKIRTYNFPQDRVTDHRINQNIYGMTAFLNGEKLTDFIDELKIEEVKKYFATE